jgi:sugar transferase (PEP-CTERM/EpsH1 system associated)
MPDQRPLICHVIFRLAIGGLENGVVNLINWMPADRYRHAILCISHATDFRQRVRRPDVAIVEAHKKAGKDLAAYARLFRLLRRLKPDIVHTRNLPALECLWLARAAGVRKLVHSEHGLDVLEIDGRTARYNRLRRLCDHVVGRFITVNEDLKHWLTTVVGIAPERVAVVYNGVDTDRFVPDGTRRTVLPTGFAPDDAMVFGTIGRLEAVKDQVVIVRAFLRLLAAEPTARQRARLVIVGEGSLRGEIEHLLSDAGARDLAWLPGFRDDTPEIYRSLDVMVLPSRREGISNTALEAMASGRPVLATRVGGNPEIIIDGRTGTLVPPGDDDAMAVALAAYLAAPERIAIEGGAARAWTVERFSPRAMVEGYGAVYDGL